MTAVRILYNLAFPFVLLALLPGFAFRMIRRGKYRHKFGQRFGIYSARVRARLAGGGRTWVHAVSVGEVIVALKLIGEMRKADPAVRIVLSTTTSTGFALAGRHSSPDIEVIYNPLDFFWTVRRAIRLIQPVRLILVEAEVWPNLTAAAKGIGAQLALVNARLSQRSEARFRVIRPLSSMIFNQLDVLCAQEPADVERWKGLGVRPEKIVCTGSIKFDEEADDLRAHRDFGRLLAELGIAPESPILLAGSTHAGEERILGEIARQLRERFPSLFYIVVPRHVERAGTVRDELERLGLRLAIRSDLASAPARPDALLVDMTGELRDWYSQATVVFIGKSLTVRGGQNPAEAVAAGRPVIFGPNMQNFATLARQLVREGGAIQCANADEILRAAAELIENPERRQALSRKASRCLETHRGATARTIEALAKAAPQSVSTETRKMPGPLSR